MKEQRLLRDRQAVKSPKHHLGLASLQVKVPGQYNTKHRMSRKRQGRRLPRKPSHLTRPHHDPNRVNRDQRKIRRRIVLSLSLGPSPRVEQIKRRATSRPLGLPRPRRRRERLPTAGLRTISSLQQHRNCLKVRVVKRITPHPLRMALPISKTRPQTYLALGANLGAKSPLP